ncbi:hypothetical protein HNQ08_002771 [Deinococcus humi]|uniref:Uncharacterized protein n=1 Tax=Deinococcus humi TaxID=662880 RepID=A0A7W8JUV9_9DEIO|nr:hypothetical protein [Deinococcus humi]
MVKHLQGLALFSWPAFQITVSHGWHIPSVEIARHLITSQRVFSEKLGKDKLAWTWQTPNRQTWSVKS